MSQFDPLNIALSRELDLDGVPGALKFLNARVPHRYTGVYRIRDGLMSSVFLHDKLGQITPTDLLEVPMTSSYCQFALRDGHFMTGNAAGDARLDGHPYQQILLSYHAVALLSDTDTLYGTLCHFDFAEQPFSDDEYELLKKAGRMIPGHCPA